LLLVAEKFKPYQCPENGFPTVNYDSKITLRKFMGLGRGEQNHEGDIAL